eukprot:TRINITY_DN23486_c0_g1_i1.p1 TRINITY_DN23486_c0_g1~~TRINITY_DN23486_c0_g1_i1.p1  ORF type:complete len:688 (+),score=93.41 TRINITY_DN23486_c0_g1_i1:187-2250(+)
MKDKPQKVRATQSPYAPNAHPEADSPEKVDIVGQIDHCRLQGLSWEEATEEIRKHYTDTNGQLNAKATCVLCEKFVGYCRCTIGPQALFIYGTASGQQQQAEKEIAELQKRLLAQGMSKTKVQKVVNGVREKQRAAHEEKVLHLDIANQTMTECGLNGGNLDEAKRTVSLKFKSEPSFFCKCGDLRFMCACGVSRHKAFEQSRTSYIDTAKGAKECPVFPGQEITDNPPTRMEEDLTRPSQVPAGPPMRMEEDLTQDSVDLTTPQEETRAENTGPSPREPTVGARRELRFDAPTPMEEEAGTIPPVTVDIELEARLDELSRRCEKDIAKIQEWKLMAPSPEVAAELEASIGRLEATLRKDREELKERWARDKARPVTPEKRKSEDGAPKQSSTAKPLLGAWKARQEKLEKQRAWHCASCGQVHSLHESCACGKEYENLAKDLTMLKTTLRGATNKDDQGFAVSTNLFSHNGKLGDTKSRGLPKFIVKTLNSITEPIQLDLTADDFQNVFTDLYASCYPDGVREQGVYFTAKQDSYIHMESILEAGKDRTILLNPPFFNDTKVATEKNQLTTTMWVDKLLHWIARQTKVQAWVVLPLWEEFTCSANIFNVVNRRVIQMLRPYTKKVLTFENAKCFLTNTVGITTEMGSVTRIKSRVFWSRRRDGLSNQQLVKMITRFMTRIWRTSLRW